MAGTSETPTDGLGAHQAPHLRRQGERVTASSRLARRQLYARRCGHRGGSTTPWEWTLSGVGRQAKQGSLDRGVKVNTRLWVPAVAQTVRREHAFCFLTVQSETHSWLSFENPRDNETWHWRVLTYLSPLAAEFGCEAFGRRTRLPKRSDGTWCSGPAGFPLSQAA